MVNAITGFGYLFAVDDPRFNTMRSLISRLLAFTVGARTSFTLLENRDDEQTLIERGITTSERITIVDGAGVDGDAFQALHLPANAEDNQTLRLAVVARMLWSKGIDLAVKAVQRAREQNPQITLTLVGAPDPLNPQAIPEEQLSLWAALPGVDWVGYRDDVRTVWAEHDVAMLLSRGGEGLPRSLIEAAACGRPIITTNVPGCKEIVIDGKTGSLITDIDSDAVASAILELARLNRDDLAEMARSSRAHFETRFTEQAVTNRVTALYARAFDWASAANRLPPIRGG